MVDIFRYDTYSAILHDGNLKCLYARVKMEALVEIACLPLLRKTKILKQDNKTSYFPATCLETSSSFITWSNSSDFLENASDAVFNSWSFANMDVLFERAPKK